MSSNKKITRTQFIPGVFPAVLINCKESKGLYGEYYKFYFDVDTGDGHTTTAEYRTSTKCVSTSPRGPSALYQFASAVLSKENLSTFEVFMNTDMLVGKQCNVLLERDKDEYGVVVTKIFPQFNYQ